MPTGPKKRKKTPKRKLIIFDTTLRDGEQSPGASLNVAEKLDIARQLEKLRVDVIEAGFPISSQGDFDAVRKVAQEIRGASIAGLARCMRKDIIRAAEAVEKAARPRIHVFLATSEVHRKHKLHKAQDEIVRLAAEGVRLAKKYTDDVEFSPEDASRTEPDFLARVVEAVIDAGAITVNIPDTVGYAMPQQFGDLIRGLRQDVKNIDQAVISVHCHNDLGLAVANSLAAVAAGARQVECTVNGLGERAGNAALEEVVMAIRTRSDFFQCDTRIDTSRITRASHMVSALTGLSVQRNKAIVGANAFAHEAGIHQDGILKERTTYEIMKPKDIGLAQGALVLGKHSGRHAFRVRIKELGYQLTDEQVNSAFEHFKLVADRKKEVVDRDLAAIVEEAATAVPEIFKMENFHSLSGSGTVPTAMVRLRTQDDEVVQDASTGDGPIDALFKAVDRITGLPGKLLEYHIDAVTGGKDALGEVALLVKCKGFTVRGRAASTDILEASLKAYLSAINRVAAKLEVNNTETTARHSKSKRKRKKK